MYPECCPNVRFLFGLGENWGSWILAILGRFPVDSGWRDRAVEQREAGSVKTAKSGKFHADWRILAAGLAEPA